MAEQCGTEVPEDVDEYNREERIETLYQGWGAREMAERIVELEDELGADVDGVCTGMHADVAEAWAEIERLRIQVEQLQRGNETLEGVSDEATKARNEAQEDAQYFESWATGTGHRLNAMTADRDRYRLAWLSARRRAADEANKAQEAVDWLRFDRDRWRRGHETAEAQLVHERRENMRLRAELGAKRQTFDAPRLQRVGQDEDGEIWRLVDFESS